MISKKQLVGYAVDKFIQFGSKHITMDELASLLGISKRSIYKHFTSKEDLVVESIHELIAKFTHDINPILEEETSVFQKMVKIYDKAFDYLIRFQPTFVVGLKKYYPKAYEVYNRFTEDFVFITLLNELKQAQKEGLIRVEIDLHLFCLLYLHELDKRMVAIHSIIDKYSKEVLLEHMIINSLRGIAVNANF
ncbi:TetR/AcrR family transcriptional regulator [Tenacibaculum sp. TC6]|uniref:TetR/AcrR family transcriptional regulator n=1 Tax=Tenacibaculum sp. TC6 TaxID=3423223 RepID=UPI003D35D63C